MFSERSSTTQTMSNSSVALFLRLMISSRPNAMAGSFQGEARPRERDDVFGRRAGGLDAAANARLVADRMIAECPLRAVPCDATDVARHSEAGFEHLRARVGSTSGATGAPNRKG